MDIINKIYEYYYKEIMNYCYVRLNFNQSAAEECTQEVFFALYKKSGSLNLRTNIRAWLYKAAEIEIKKYIRKNPINEDIDDYEISVEADFIENSSSSIENILNTDELELAKEYYSGEDKNIIAEKHNLSINAMYSKIKRIKKKLKDFMKL